MARIYQHRGSSTPPLPLRVLKPALYSMPELHFLLDNLEKSPNVALHGRLPEGVNPAAVRPLLLAMSELEELERERNIPWKGYTAVREKIAAFIEWQEKCLEIYEDGGPRHPSQSQWDEEGMAFRGMVGADSNEMVATEILDTGERRSFNLKLTGEVREKSGGRGLMPWVKQRKATGEPADTLTHNPKSATLVCGICDHTVTYNKKRGKQAYHLARGHMSKHLLTAKTNTSRHRMLYQREYRGLKAKAS